jgi:hypothetical protein
LKKGIFAGAFVALAIAVVVWLEMRNRVVFNAVLEIQLGAIAEQKDAKGAEANARPAVMLDEAEVRDMERAMDAGRNDQRVVGLAILIGKVEASPANLKEIAAHMMAFRKAGKPAACVLDEEDEDNLANSIAVGCDKRIGTGPDADDDVTEYFDGKFGDENWSRIELRAYLRQVREGR